ncbi:MAG: hypothetical protein LBQ37_02395 [Elusimicrobiota bacterium]|jgi:hypothetical protein|nr:hypothetical protein [Elusimicrobiota bacterium]
MIKLSGFWLQDLVILVSVLCGFFGGVIALKKYLFSFLFSSINEELKKINYRLQTQEKQMSMIVMHMTTIDLPERIDAGQRYVDAGGNGSEKMYLEKLKREYEAVLK